MSELAKVISVLPCDGMHGRRQIMTYKKQITKDNVVDVITAALDVHYQNAAEEIYLYNYYRGKQDIRTRIKKIRPEIKNTVTVNRANEIVTFKTSYLLGEPLQYVSNGGSDEVSEKIDYLNTLMYSERKAAKDKEVSDWLHICGVAPRLVLADPADNMQGSPAVIYTLTPMEAGCIYYSGIGHKRLAGFILQKDENGENIVCVYTDTDYFEIKGNEIVKEEKHTYGTVPLVEYVHNYARIGAFEPVLPILNAINTIESNRIDDIEQFVQSIMVFENCEISEDQANALKEQLGLMINSDPSKPSKVYRIDGQLSQTGAQTVVDNLTDEYITICGMPNRNGGSSTSDTGAAVIMRDGWSAAEARAKDTGVLYEQSELEFLRVYLKILSDTNVLDLNLADIGMKFTRQNYADIQSKAQVLAELLNNPLVHPKIAYRVSGITPDTEEAYRLGLQWRAEEQQSESERLEAELNAERENVQALRQNNTNTEQESNTEVSESQK